MKSSKFSLSEEKTKKLNVQSLKPNHLPILALSKQTRRLGWLQIMLIKTLLAQAEEKLQGLIPTRQPKCLVALENDQLIALVVLQPNNRRGTSWSISLPEFLNDPKEATPRQIQEVLLQNALQLESNIARSWLITCPKDDLQQLEITRELGFQPLKTIKRWTFKNSLNNKDDEKYPFLPKNILWESLTKKNAAVLSKLEKGSQSVHLRELIDRQWIDLLDKNGPDNKILISTDINHKVGLFGLITPIGSEDLLSLELIRDVAWDSRLSLILPKLLTGLTYSSQQISLETAAEDTHLNHILIEMGWEEKNEKLLLGRSLLKRKHNPKLHSVESSFEKILSSLQPNQPSIPSPPLSINQ